MKHKIKSTHIHGFCFSNGTVIGTNPVEIDDKTPGFEDFHKFVGKGIDLHLDKEEAKKVLPDAKPVIKAAPVAEPAVEEAKIEEIKLEEAIEAKEDVVIETPKESKKKNKFFSNN